MTQPHDPCFLNLDIEISSVKNLAPLADFFGKRVCVLFSDYIEEEVFKLVVEAAPRSHKKVTPECSIRYFLKLFEAIPDNLRELWDTRSALLFDLGFESGIAPPPYPVPTGTRLNLYYESMSSKILGQVANLKGAIGITIYPYYPDSPSDSKLEPIATNSVRTQETGLGSKCRQLSP